MSDEPEYDQREVDLEEAFLADPKFGLKYLDATFRKDISRYIKSNARGLNAHEVADVYQETLMDLLPKLDDESFDWHKPMAIVLQLACTNAIDAMRRKGYRTKKEADDAALPFIASDMRDTRVHRHWRHADPVVRNEFRRALDEVIDKLPGKQKVVAVCFHRLFSELRERDKWAPIAKELERVTGEPHDATTAKAAWHEARKTIMAQLKRRGFEYLD